MPSTTHADAFHFSHPVASYWEASAPPLDLPLLPLAGDVRCDVAIIGGGYAGLSAALELAAHGIAVRVLEAAEPGWGASGRNGGFACVGSHKLSYARMIQKYGLDESRRYYRNMKEAVELVSALCRHHDIDVDACETGDMTLAHLPSRLHDFAADVTFMKQAFGEDMMVLTPEALKDQGLNGAFFGGLKMNHGFGLHPLKYVRGLARAAHRAGAVIHPHSRLLRWQEQDGLHHLHTGQGRLIANRVLIATNGYTPEDVMARMRGRLMPALSNIITTRPLSRSEQEAQGWTSTLLAFDSRKLLHYFRLLPDGRFLFGGRGGTDASAPSAAVYREKLVAEFHALFPHWRDVEISHFCRGFVCLAHDLVPYVGPLDDRASVFAAVAWHGNGVAMATLAGREAARRMVGLEPVEPLSAIVTRRLARFPLAAFRPLYLKGAYLWFNWQDSR
jgi:glycine/D-amino acid oxidase-like deaminating enzyme